MKIGIVTFHFVNNFGGALQAYALQKTISDKCNETPIIVDYRNWFIRFTDFIRLFPITGNVSEVISGLKTLKQRFSRVRKFCEFIKKNYKMTRFYVNGLALYIFPPKCDKYICGSDQIWNPILTGGIASPYFLGFVKNSKDKFSYAPSFGSSFLHKIFKKRIKNYLLSLGSISVREIDGVQLVKSLTGRGAERLIDPSFLLEKSEWDSIAVTPSVEGRYILLYIMQRDDSIYDYAKKLKDKLEVQLVEISRYGYKPDFVDVSLVNIGPGEFIGLFQNADYVCTNSYHGLSFSIIFEKEVYLIPCKRFKSRINNLLELLKIDEPLESQTDNHVPLNYNKVFVRQIIRQERDKSIEYLKRNIMEQEG